MSNIPFLSTTVDKDVDLNAVANGYVFGQPLDLKRLTSLSVQVVATGVAGATTDKVMLQGSDVIETENGPKPWSDTDLYWQDITSAEVTLGNGTNCFTFSAADLNSRFVRLVYEKVSITAGTAEVYATAKNG